jgi:hypothetical protein
MEETRFGGFFMTGYGWNLSSRPTCYMSATADDLSLAG